MKKILKKQKYINFNILLTAGLFLFGVALFFLLYSYQRTKTDVYVAMTLGKFDKQPYIWTAYYTDNAISVHDKETTTLGETSAEIIDKESYDAPGWGRAVTLLLKMKVVKDRTGIYLYKNKPIQIGSDLDLKLPKASVNGTIIFMDTKPPSYKYKKITFLSKFRAMEPSITDKLNVGSVIVNNKGIEIAKILDKKVSDAEVRVDTASGITSVSYNPIRKDMLVSVVILAKEIGGSYYFGDTQAVKTNDTIFLPWKEENLSHWIISIDDIKDFNPK